MSRELEKQAVNYLGFAKPENINEIEIEVLGLENAIKQAELRISELKQGVSIAKRQWQENEEKKTKGFKELKKKVNEEPKEE